MDLVKKENEVILLEDDYTTKYAGYDPNNPASVISFAVMHNSFQDQSLDMASRVQDQFRTKAKRKDRGVKAGQFLVLWKTTMPSILIETGFISDPTEEAFLMSDYGQDLIASAIYRAFRDYKQDFDEKTTQDLASNASAVNNAVSNPQRRSSETTQTQDRIEVEKKQVVNDAGVGGKTENTSKSVTIEYSEPDLHFRVQILASQNQIPIDSKEFKGYSDLEELKIDGYFKYMSKPVASYAQALELRKQMVKTFPGAFVVGFKSGKKIPLMKAIEEDKKIH